MSRRSRAKPPSPFRYFNSPPEVIRLVVLMSVRFPLSLRKVEDLLFELLVFHGAEFVEEGGDPNGCDEDAEECNGDAD